LESYPPNVNEVITFFFPAKVLRKFARKHRDWSEGFGFSIDNLVKIPLAATWTFPEFNMTLWTLGKYQTWFILG